MSKPTQEQIEEARGLMDKAVRSNVHKQGGVFFDDITDIDLASIIAFVRAQENNDTLERAAEHFLEDGTHADWIAYGIAGDLRAMKTPTAAP